jgi:hypothetical protein
MREKREAKKRGKARKAGALSRVKLKAAAAAVIRATPKVKKRDSKVPDVVEGYQTDHLAEDASEAGSDSSVGGVPRDSDSVEV